MPFKIDTARGGRIGRPWASCAGNQQFGSRLCQSDDLKIYTCRFLVRRSTLLGRGKNLLAQCQDNVLEWDIKSWHWWPNFPVWIHYKVASGAHCHKSSDHHDMT